MASCSIRRNPLTENFPGRKQHAQWLKAWRIGASGATRAATELRPYRGTVNPGLWQNKGFPSEQRLGSNAANKKKAVPPEALRYLLGQSGSGPECRDGQEEAGRDCKSGRHERTTPNRHSVSCNQPTPSRLALKNPDRLCGSTGRNCRGPDPDSEQNETGHKNRITNLDPGRSTSPFDHGNVWRVERQINNRIRERPVTQLMTLHP